MFTTCQVRPVVSSRLSYLCVHQALPLVMITSGASVHEAPLLNV